MQTDTTIPLVIAPELLPELLAGVECRAFKLDQDEDGHYHLIVHGNLSTMPAPLQDQALRDFLGVPSEPACPACGDTGWMNAYDDHRYCGNSKCEHTEPLDAEGAR